MKYRNLFATLSAAFLFAGIASANTLSANSVTNAAQAALAACQAAGYRVTVTVVDASGSTLAVIRGDGAAPHTVEASARKAYTAATFGSSSGLNLTSEISSRLLANVETQQLGSLPNILLVSGGAVVRKDGMVIGAVGVGGAPNGRFDEECAQVAVEKILTPQ